MCTISSTKECFHKGWRLSLHPTPRTQNVTIAICQLIVEGILKEHEGENHLHVITQHTPRQNQPKTL